VLLLLVSFKVLSYSMLPAIEGGDYVLVNKMIPEPRVPVSWRAFFRGNDLRLRRLAGYRRLQNRQVAYEILVDIPYNIPEDATLMLLYKQAADLVKPEVLDIG
jgi:signal peptidase I